jgi:hypothetical protein
MRPILDKYKTQVTIDSLEAAVLARDTLCWKLGKYGRKFFFLLFLFFFFFFPFFSSFSSLFLFFLFFPFSPFCLEYAVNYFSSFLLAKTATAFDEVINAQTILEKVEKIVGVRGTPPSLWVLYHF